MEIGIWKCGLLKSSTSFDSVITETQWFAESQDILTTLDLQLQGKVYDFEQDKWTTNKHVKPLINDQGRNAILSILRTEVNKIQIVSDFSEERINRELYNFQVELGRLLAINWVNYEIKNHYQMTLVKQMVSIVAAVKYSAKDGRFGNKVLTPATVVQNVRSNNAQMPIGRNQQ